MHNTESKTGSKTDWDRVRSIKDGDHIPYDPEDGPYDPNDPVATDAWLSQADVLYKGKVIRRGKRGPQKTPTKKLVSLRLSPEVIDHFKSSGPGWQTRINGALLESSRLESELREALQTREFTIKPEELEGRSLVSLLREKLARR